MKLLLKTGETIEIRFGGALTGHRVQEFTLDLQDLQAVANSTPEKVHQYLSHMMLMRLDWQTGGTL